MNFLAIRPSELGRKISSLLLFSGMFASGMAAAAEPTTSWAEADPHRWYAMGTLEASHIGGFDGGIGFELGRHFRNQPTGPAIAFEASGTRIRVFAVGVQLRWDVLIRSHSTFDAYFSPTIASGVGVLHPLFWSSPIGWGAYNHAPVSPYAQAGVEFVVDSRPLRVALRLEAEGRQWILGDESDEFYVGAVATVGIGASF